MEREKLIESLLDALKNDPELSHMTFRRDEFRKINVKYDALIPEGNNNALPIINIDALCDRVQGDPKDFIPTFVEEYKEQVNHAKRFANITKKVGGDYADVKDCLFIRVNNKEDNMDFIPENLPHSVPIDGITMTYHILIDTFGNDISSVPVNYSMMERWGVSEETLRADAIANSVSLFPPVLRDIGEMFGEQVNLHRIYCLTNKSSLNGAAALFYPGVMDQISSFTGGSFYALPSSIHEFVICKADENAANEEDMKEMIKSINTNMVLQETPEAYLSDNLYFYDSTTKAFTCRGAACGADN